MSNLSRLLKRLSVLSTFNKTLPGLVGLILGLASLVVVEPRSRQKSKEATPFKPPSESTSERSNEGFNNPAKDRVVNDRGVPAEQEDEANGLLSGWHLGYYWVPQSDHVMSDDAPRPLCKNDELRYVDISELKASSIWFDLPTVLPPGAVKHNEPVGVACRSQIIAIDQEIDFRPQGGSVGFGKVVGPTSRFVFGRTSSSRVTLSRVSGREVVIISPLTPEGYGDGTILVRNDQANATLTLASMDFPLPELVKLAKQVIEAGAI